MSQRRDRSLSPHRIAGSAKFESGPPSSKIVPYSEDDGEIMEIVKEEEWEERKKKTTTKTRNVEKRTQRKVVLEDGLVVGDTGPIVSEDATEDTTVKEEHSDLTERPEGQLALTESPPEGWISAPGAVVISEKSTKTTKSHDEKQDELETEEIQRCGDVTNEEAEGHIRGDNDLREIIANRESEGLIVAKPRKRIVYEGSRARGNVLKTNIKESSKIKDGHVLTSTERTIENEEYEKESAPDSASSMSDGSVRQEKNETSHNIIHTKDEDLLEYYAVPKGKSLAKGVKIGEGMHVVSEDKQEEKHGDPDKVRTHIRRPQRKYPLTKSLLQYDQEERARKKETDKWLEHHFGSESGRSEDSVQGDSESGIRHEEITNPNIGNKIKVHMSPYPAPKDDYPSWKRDKAIPAPPPPPKPKRNWSTNAQLSDYERTSSPVSPSYSSLKYTKSPPISPVSPGRQSYDVHETDISTARSKLRPTGLKLVNENKENMPSYPSRYLEFSSAKDSSKYESDSFKTKDNSSRTNGFHNVNYDTKDSGSKYVSFNSKTKDNSSKDDVIYGSKFRSGVPKTQIGIQIPSLTNVGRSQSFHVGSAPQSLSTTNYSTNIERDTNQNKFRTSKDYRSEEHLLDDGGGYNSENIKSYFKDENETRKYRNLRNYRNDEYKTYDSRHLSKYDSPRKIDEPDARNYSTKSHTGKEAGTQTVPSPIPPPRMKRRTTKPQSSYFFGEQNGDIYTRPHNNRHNNQHSLNETTDSYDRKYDTEYSTTSSPKTKGSKSSRKHREGHINEKYNVYDNYSPIKSTWTNTVDPRRRPRVQVEEDRPITLPRKLSKESRKPEKSYIFGEVENRHNGYITPREKEKIHYTTINRSESQNVGHKSSKPVERSRSFNVEASRRNKHVNGFSDHKPLSEISHQKNTSLYSSSPYVGLKSPNLIATLSRTPSQEIKPMRMNGYTEHKNERKDRFMKGLLNTAPELYHFIHGEEDPHRRTSSMDAPGREREIKVALDKNYTRQPQKSSNSHYKSTTAINSQYSAPVYKFGKGENSTLIRNYSSEVENKNILNTQRNLFDQNTNGYSDSTKHDFSRTNGYSVPKTNGYISSQKSSSSAKINGYSSQQNLHNSSYSSEDGKKKTPIYITPETSSREYKIPGYKKALDTNRKTEFNLKTHGSSLLYSPSFRNDKNKSLKRRESDKQKRERYSEEFSSNDGSRVQMRDWTVR